jgi:hypothetical protein
MLILCSALIPSLDWPDRMHFIALFVGNVRVASIDYRYTVGIAAKNYDKSSTADKGDIKEECRKFNDMFIGSELKDSPCLNSRYPLRP